MCAFFLPSLYIFGNQYVFIYALYHCSHGYSIFLLRQKSLKTMRDQCQVQNKILKIEVLPLKNTPVLVEKCS